MTDTGDALQRHREQAGPMAAAQTDTDPAVAGYRDDPPQGEHVVVDEQTGTVRDVTPSSAALGGDPKALGLEAMEHPDGLDHDTATPEDKERLTGTPLEEPSTATKAVAVDGPDAPQEQGGEGEGNGGLLDPLQADPLEADGPPKAMEDLSEEELAERLDASRQNPI